LKAILELADPGVDERIASLGETWTERYRRVVEAASRIFFTGEQRPDEISVSVSLVSRDAMSQLNLQHRHVQGPTDVLSFPLWETEGRFAPPPGWMSIPLGDIVICADIVEDNANSNGSSFAAEFFLVMVHGLLHLFGMNHDTLESKEQMWRLQHDMLKSMIGRSPLSGCAAEGED